MTTRGKSTLVILGTLAIGMVLGAVINAWMADRRFERVGYFRSERGFLQHLLEAIEPVEESQRAAVEEILDRSAARMRAHMDSSGAEGRAIMDATRAELATILSPEQLSKLDERMRRGKGRRGERGNGRGGDRGMGR